MSRVLFVGAGQFQTDGIVRANELGLHTIAMDGNANAYGKDYAKEFYHVDICDKDAVLAKARSLNIDAVVAIASEVSLESMAYVAEKLDLPGYKTRHIDISHNKDRYYALFAANGIKVPRTWIYQGASTVAELEPGRKYIVKPSQGSGSRGVKIVNDIRSFDLSAYIERYLKRDEAVIIQEFVRGKEITIDGFVHDRTFHLLAISQEYNDEAKGHTFSSELDFPPEWMTRGTKEELWAICDRIVKALDLSDDGPMHLEMLKTGNDGFYVIDFSLRGGGFDLFTKIDRLVTGIDPLELYLKSATRLPVGDIPTVSDDCHAVTLNFFYPEHAGTVSSIVGMELEGMHEDFFFKPTHGVGEPVADPESGSQRLGYLICWNSDRAALKARQQELLKQIDFKIG